MSWANCQCAQVPGRGCRGCRPWSSGGWGRCTHAWASTRPSSPSNPTRSYPTVNVSYTCSNFESELEKKKWKEKFRNPTILLVSVRPSLEPGWLEGILDGRVGLVPENYVEFITWSSSIISDAVRDGDRKEFNELVLPDKWRIDTLENIKEDHFVSRLNNLVRFCGESLKSPNKHIWKLL